MGVDQAFLYPTWFAEGFLLVQRSGHRVCAGAAYNDWIADFCKAAPQRLFAAAMLPLQNMDFALEELSAGRAAIRRSAAFSFGRCSSKTATSTTPITIRCGPRLERLGMIAAVHPTPGLWNPEWTSHGPFVEKVKDRSGQPTVAGRRRRAVRRRSAGLASTTFFTASPQLGHPMAPILSNWLDNHMFVASTLIGFTVMERFPGMKVVVAHGKASWMQEVLEKMEASSASFRCCTNIRCAPTPRRCGSTATSCSASTPRSG